MLLDTAIKHMTQQYEYLKGSNSVRAKTQREAIRRIMLYVFSCKESLSVLPSDIDAENLKRWHKEMKKIPPFPKITGMQKFNDGEGI